MSTRRSRSRRTSEQARALIALADRLGLRLSCAPSNAMSDTTQTMWKAVRDGAVGDPRIVYAEFDDNVIYRMHPETWRSRTGAPWPYLHEYEWGCTYEHVGYHLTWLCAIFGPVESVTAFSKQALPDKTNLPLHPPDTPDFSVACLNFQSGVVARVTCSIGAPYDHRMRIIGNAGMLTADTYRHYRCPVYLETVQPVDAERAQGHVGAHQFAVAEFARRWRRQGETFAQSPAGRGRARYFAEGAVVVARATSCGRRGGANSASRTRPSALQNSRTPCEPGGRPSRPMTSPCI